MDKNIDPALKDGNIARVANYVEHVAREMLGVDNTHPKLLSYPRLDYYLWYIANMTLIPVFKPKPSVILKILHVATEIYYVGGHTKVFLELQATN